MTQPVRPRDRSLSAVYFSLIESLVKAPAILILGFGIPFLLALLQLPKLDVVSDLRALIPEDTVSERDKTIRNRFNIDDYMIVVLTSDRTVYATPSLAYMETLSRGFGALPGVTRVRSLLTEDNLLVDAQDALVIQPFVPEVSPVAAARAPADVQRFPGASGILVSSSGRHGALLVGLEGEADKAAVFRSIEGVLAAHPAPPGMTTVVSGMPVMEGVLGAYIIEDLVVMLPIVLFVLMALTLAAFRSWPVAVFCLIETVYVDVVALGLMAAVGSPLYVIQAIMPVILMGLAITDEIHIFSRFFEEDDRDPHASIRDKVRSTMSSIGRPVVLTSLTTAAAFLAFQTSSMAAMREFGLYTAFGVMLAMLFSCLVTPVFIARFRLKRSGHDSFGARSPRLSRLGSTVMKRERWLGAGVLILVGLSILGVARLTIDDAWIENFKKHSNMRVADSLINENLAGTMLLFVETDTGAPDGVFDPEFLHGLEAARREIEDLPGVGAAIAMTQPVGRLHDVLGGPGDLPSSLEAAAQYVFLLDDSSYRDMWDFEYRYALMTVFVKTATYQHGMRTFPKLDAIMASHTPACGWSYGGHYALGVHWVDLINVDLPRNLLLSLVAVVVLSSILFRSLKSGLLVVAPVALAVLMNFGVMGLVGVEIGVAISMFSAIVFGIGIDYAIHLRSGHALAGTQTEDRERRLNMMYGSAGRAVFLSAALVVASFLVLLLSQMPPIQELGMVVSIGVLSSFAASFLLMGLWQR